MLFLALSFQPDIHQQLKHQISCLPSHRKEPSSDLYCNRKLPDHQTYYLHLAVFSLIQYGVATV